MPTKRKLTKIVRIRKSTASKKRQASSKQTKRKSSLHILVPDSKWPKAKFSTRVGVVNTDGRVEVTLALRGPSSRRWVSLSAATGRRSSMLQR
jgi:hypothetical protein